MKKLFQISDCDCSARGSFDGKTCANKSGSCKCKPNVVGPKCDRCNEGYLSYPECDKQIRLGGGSNPSEGYVEINYKGQGWKGVCDDIPDGYTSVTSKRNAKVICKTAGYPKGAYAVYTASSPFGYGSSGDDFVLDDVVCTGDEETVFECSHNDYNSENCSKTEWLGVKCRT